MHPNPPAHSSGTAARRTILSRLLLALLCVVGLCASLLQPPSARGLSTTDTPFLTASLKDHAINGGKPCQRMVRGAVGISCGAGAVVGLETTTAVVLGPVVNRRRVPMPIGEPSH